MATPKTEDKKMILKSSDGELFEVKISVASQSQTLKDMIKDLGDDSLITIPVSVESKILAKVIEYCSVHANESLKEEDLKKFDKEFVQLDQDVLFPLIMAADYLHIAALQDITCQQVADMIKGKNPDEIRETFCIENDFSPEEYTQVWKDNSWAFE